MPLDQLEKVIRQAAAAQAEKISGESATEIGREQKRVTQAARALEEQVIDRARATAEQQRRLIQQSSRLAAKAEVLTAKQTELAQVFSDALGTILQWPTEKSEVLIKSLLKELPAEAGVITAGAAHADLIRKLASSKLYTISSETIPDEGGFRYENEQVVIDMRVSQLLGALLRQNRNAIASALFS